MKALFKKIRHNIGKIILFSALAVFYLTCGCPIRFFTGISCPGCGMSRAAAALLRLDLPLALEMHPLVLLLPVAAIIYFARRLMPKRILRLLLGFALILLITVYIVRMNSDSSIVYADFENGMIFRLFDKLNQINIF